MERANAHIHTIISLQKLDLCLPLSLTSNLTFFYVYRQTFVDKE
jgi:hypothetical protein